MNKHQEILGNHRLVSPLKHRVSRSVDTSNDSYKEFLKRAKSSSTTPIEPDLTKSPMKFVRYPIDSTK